MIRTLFKVLKWLLVGTGSIAAILIVYNLLWTRYGYKVASPYTVVVGIDSNPCQFSFEVPYGFWMPDTQTGTPAWVRTWNKNPRVYLYAGRSFRSSYPGDWLNTSAEFKCTITPRTVVPGKHGATISTFYANRCHSPPGAWEHFKNANVLFAEVPVGEEMDVIAFTSLSEKDLLTLAPEFSKVVATHYAPPKGSACAKKMK